MSCPVSSAEAWSTISSSHANGTRSRRPTALRKLGSREARLRVQTIIEMVARSRSVIIPCVRFRAAELAGSGFCKGQATACRGTPAPFGGAAIRRRNREQGTTRYAHDFCIPRNREREVTAHRGFHVDVPPSLIQSVRLVHALMETGYRVHVRPEHRDRFSRLEEVFGITYVVGVEGASAAPRRSC